MRAVIQRVKEASCQVEGKTVGSINKGMVVFLGIGKEDEIVDAEYLARKIVNLRIFEDNKGKMNLSLLQIKGEILIIPQFTLYGDCKRGFRPNFIKAASSESAQMLYQEFVKLTKRRLCRVGEGKFGLKMRVRIDNDGPVTLILDSRGR